MWVGAFLSFVGSWIQNVAQGWLVFEITHDEAKLAIISFCGLVPVSVLGPVAGAITGAFHKKVVLVVAQATFGCGALFLAYMSWPRPGLPHGYVQFEHFVGVALVFGIMGAFEMPARQSVISRVVPPDVLGAAIPVNAMTFNSARIVGPAIGGILMEKIGPNACYLTNGMSYLAMIFAVLTIHADLSALPRSAEPFRELILEGFRYTFRDIRLKTLFFMEAATAGFGLVYIQLLPAFAKTNLGLDKRGLGYAMTAIGIGALSGLLITASLSEKKVKRRLVIGAMLVVGTGLILVSLFRVVWIAVPLMGIVGGAAIIQFNTTNTLFQQIAPPQLRERVIAMHVWALSGIGPFGTLLLGYIARLTKPENPQEMGGVPFAYLLGGVLVLFGGIAGYLRRERLSGLP